VALVVLLRGANLGKRRFSPAQLVKDLAELEIANLGAAGTFVVRRKVAERTLRAKIGAELPWDDPEMVILQEAEVRDALDAGAKVEVPAGAKRFGTALPQAPAKKPKLPVTAEAKDGAWGMRIEALVGRVAIGVRRRFDQTGTYSLKPIEAALGTDRGTMRDWPTWEKIGALLEESE
jgi:hypothetical protein